MISADFKRRVEIQSPLKIVVGSSGHFEEGWLPTNKKDLDLLSEEQWDAYFCNNKIDALLAEHVWEHLTEDEGLAAAKNCYQHLKPGGYLRIAVPDGFHPDKEYIDWVKVNGVGAGAEDHKVLYNYQTFSDLFKKAGFNVYLLEYFDQNGDFIVKNWDPKDGLIRRSKRFDPRNQDGKIRYTSIILDAQKEK